MVELKRMMDSGTTLRRLLRRISIMKNIQFTDRHAFSQFLRRVKRLKMFSGGFIKFSEYSEKFEMARGQIRDRLKDNGTNKNMDGQETIWGGRKGDLSCRAVFSPDFHSH
jgi:hypothetical protein